MNVHHLQGRRRPGFHRIAAMVCVQIFVVTLLGEGQNSSSQISSNLTASNLSASRLASVRRMVLSNGLRLLLKPEPASEKLTIAVCIQMPEESTPLEAATGELVANALFLGSSNRSRRENARVLAQLGGVETRCGPGHVAITCRVDPGLWSEAILLLAEALKNADFDADALAIACQATSAARRKSAADNFENATAALHTALYGAHAPDDALRKRVTPAQALAYFRQRYVPSRTAIALVGSFDPEQAQRSLEINFEDYTRRAPRAVPFATPPGSVSPQRTPKTPGVAYAAEQTLTAFGGPAYALIGTDAPEVAHPDYPAFTVLSTLLGGGHASRLFRRVRDARGFGYTVGTNYQAERAAALVAYVQFDPRRAPAANAAAAASRAATALQLLNAQFDSLLTEPPTEAEIVRARNLAIGRDVLQHERALDRAFLLAWYEAVGPGYAFDEALPHRLAAVTCADLLRVARTYFTARAAVTILPDPALSRE